MAQVQFRGLFSQAGLALYFAICRKVAPCQLQRFLSFHDQIANQFMQCRYNRDAKAKRELRDQALAAWSVVTGATMM
jgi:hypothetical protein